jgi:hypothetical protein
MGATALISLSDLPAGAVSKSPGFNGSLLLRPSPCVVHGEDGRVESHGQRQVAVAGPP